MLFYRWTGREDEGVGERRKGVREMMQSWSAFIPAEARDVIDCVDVIEYQRLEWPSSALHLPHLLPKPTVRRPRLPKLRERLPHITAHARRQQAPTQASNTSNAWSVATK